ncbi:MAG: polysaccharide deacetylase family protein [Puniceicoccales bacterium]
MMLASASSLHALDAPVIPTIEQELVVVGEPVHVAIEPVYDGNAWAFTARWDDNHKINLMMRDAMADIGMKGTFYLNRSAGQYGAGEEYALALIERGSSIGGHTTWHYSLPTLNPNTLFREILLNRIEREAEVDTPITSFAFPFGRYSDRDEVDAMQRVTDAWLRSGYHHNVYHGFVYNNPYMPDGYASSVHQVKPGDFTIDAESFEKQVNRILANPQQYQKDDPAISLGVHARQSPEEMDKFKALISDYSGRDDFWKCNETELAAYRLQAKHTQLLPDLDTPNDWHVVRPRAAYAGADVPLTLRLRGPEPEKVMLDGHELECRPDGDSWLVNLPYGTEQGAPEKISWLQNGPGEHRPTPDNDFPGLDFRLEPTRDEGWSLTLTNDSDVTVRDIQVIMRLPLYYADGVRMSNVGELLPGDSVKLHFERGPVVSDPSYQDGAVFAAAEIDFNHDGVPGRIYASYIGEAAVRLGEDVRDAAVVVGPLPPDFSVKKLLAYSRPGAPFSPVTDSPLGQWRTVSDEVRAEFAANRFVVYNRERAWRKPQRPTNASPLWSVSSVIFHWIKAAL